MYIYSQQKSDTTKDTNQKIIEIIIESIKDQIRVHKYVKGEFMLLLISEKQHIQN